MKWCTDSESHTSPALFSPARSLAPHAAVAEPSTEPPSAALKQSPSVEIVNLVKTYGSGRLKKTAVDGLNLSFYAGQISCLLGHNGAGKTSTLAVLTGLYPPTKGDCYVFGYSISKARDVVYRMLGICPQHDVLWDELTGYEHLHLFATMRGMEGGERAGVEGTGMQGAGMQGECINNIASQDR